MLVRKVLHWTAVDSRLSFAELQESVSLPDPLGEPFGDDHLVDTDRILDECRSLVKVRQDDPDNPDNIYVEFAHFTVAEYLVSIDSRSELSVFRLQHEAALVELYKACLRSILAEKSSLDYTEWDPILVLQHISLKFNTRPFYYYSTYTICGSSFTNNLEHDVIWASIEGSAYLESLEAIFRPERRGNLLQLLLGIFFRVCKVSPADLNRDFWDSFEGSCDDKFFVHALQLLKFAMSDAVTPLKLAAALGIPDLCRAIASRMGDVTDSHIQACLCCAIQGMGIFTSQGDLEQRFLPSFAVITERRCRTVNYFLSFKRKTTGVIQPEWPLVMWKHTSTPCGLRRR